MQQVTLGELKLVHALSELPDEHLQWLLDHTEYREFKDGELLVRHGDPVDHMWFMIEGSAKFYMDVNGQQVYYYDFENSSFTGGLGGVMPYSRLKISPGWAYAVGNVRILGLHRDHFRELENLNMEFIQRTIAYMTDRARHFATQQTQQEKVSALGKLAAGIAHELNNPAAAISRISSELNKRLDLNLELTRSLLSHGVISEQLVNLQRILIKKIPGKHGQAKLTALKRLQMEDDLRDWLLSHGIEDHTELSETFTHAGIGVEEFEQIFEMTGAASFESVMRWLENHMITQKMVLDLDHASGRISNLVGAIKSHVHMDRTNDMQPTNVIADVENTLMLLGHKLSEKNIDVERKYKEPLPEIDAFIGELNQVWMNVIDNAIYAMEKNGKLIIEIFGKNSDVKVNITDNGSGIPEKVLSKIFDPFFTTKKVGQGTGIGLDLVARIIKRHNGEIKVSSKPGCTEFRICIPVHQPSN